jgi:TetR/AcrR family transcriptional regulator
MNQLKPRQLDIMQNLATMLSKKGPVKITTSLLAKECGITEAAIYRHFPSKKKIYSGLVDFCEESLFSLIANINKSQDEPLEKIKKILILLISFSEKNPGLARILTREAFSIDESSLDIRIKLLFSKIELQIKQLLQEFEQKTKNKLLLTTTSSAILLLAVSEGLIQRFVRSGFDDKPSDRAPEQIQLIINSLSSK